MGRRNQREASQIIHAEARPPRPAEISNQFSFSSLPPFAPFAPAVPPSSRQAVPARRENSPIHRSDAALR